MRGVTVVTPTLPSREEFLEQALASIRAQTVRIDAMVVEPDTNPRQGAWATRNRAIGHVETEWTAFLDDDDLLLPHHVEFLTDRAKEHDLDLCWGWFDVIDGTDPWPENRGRQYDPTAPHVFPITVLVRTEMLHNAIREMGGFQPDTDSVSPGVIGWGSWYIQDQPTWNHLICNQKARHMAFPDRIWRWRHHGSNSSGLPRGGGGLCP